MNDDRAGIWIELKPEHWMEVPERITASVGLHAIIGANNSGKSYFLNLFTTARFGRYAQMDANRRAAVTWDVTGDFQFTDATIETKRKMAFEFDDTDYEKLANVRAWGTMKIDNRDFSGTCQAAESGIQENPESWPALMLSYENGGPTEREMWGTVATEFEKISGHTIRIGVNSGKYKTILYRHDVESPLKQCGTGMRDLIAIIFFVVTHPNEDILIEEPGTHLHPHAQQKLLNFLVRSSQERAIWITTHAPIFSTSNALSSRYSVIRVDNKTIVKEIKTTEEQQQMFDEIGFSMPEIRGLGVKELAVWVEGPSDQKVFGELARQLQSEGTDVPSLVVLNGKTSSKLTADYLKDIIKAFSEVVPGTKQMVVLDSDNLAPTEKQDIQRALKTLGVPAHFLAKTDLEAYYGEDELIKCFAERQAEHPPEKEEDISLARAKFKASLQTIDRKKPVGNQLETRFEHAQYETKKVKMAESMRAQWAKDCSLPGCVELKREFHGFLSLLSNT